MEYETRALNLDKELAELLGWEWSEGSTKHRTGPTWDTWEWIGRCGARQPRTGACQIRWTQDDGEAFRLAVEHSISPMIGSLAVVIAGSELTEIKSFPDKLSAVRWAIVQAVVNKLKGNV